MKDLRSAGEGNFSVSMNTSLNAAFHKERLGLGLYLGAGGVHIKIQMGMLVQFFLGLKFGQILFFLGGIENWHYFLGHVKLWPHWHRSTFSPATAIVIFSNYCVAIARKICNLATPVCGAIEKFADR